MLRTWFLRGCFHTGSHEHQGKLRSMTKKDLEGRGNAYSDAIMVSFGEAYRNDTRFSIIPHDL